MKTLAQVQIQRAILTLDDNDYPELMHWMSELDWVRWDAQIEADSKSGKLDFMEAEALAAKRDGTLLDYPAHPVHPCQFPHTHRLTNRNTD